MNHILLQTQKVTFILSILCFQINFAHCNIERSKPFTDGETTQLMRGFSSALWRGIDLDNANLALLDEAIKCRKTHGKIILDTLVNYRMEYGDDDTFLLEAAKTGNLALVRHLLKASAANNPNNQNVQELTSQAGEDINHQPKGVSFTPLHLAVESNHYTIAHLLITYGANINVQSLLGQTALHYAIKNNSPDIAHLLITHGANINIQDRFGQTASSIASPEMQKVIQQALTERQTR